MTTAKLTIEFSATDELRIREKLASGVLTEVPAREILYGAMAFGEADVRSEARDLGAISRSIIAEPQGAWGARIGTHNPAARPVNYGRHSRTQPPESALANWAQAHGLGGLEFVIARAIAARGIKGRFFIERTTVRLREIELPRLIEEAKAKIQARWSARV